MRTFEVDLGSATRYRWRRKNLRTTAHATTSEFGGGDKRRWIQQSHRRSAKWPKHVFCFSPRFTLARCCFGFSHTIRMKQPVTRADRRRPSVHEAAPALQRPRPSALIFDIGKIAISETDAGFLLQFQRHDTNPTPPMTIVLRGMYSQARVRLREG